jgi:hypothetical protein
MRYRALDKNGDYSFGHGQANFLVNSSATVAQAILTALLLHQGEWFLDNTVGVPYETKVVGYNTQPLYDSVIKNAINGVQGVLAITNYSSSLNTVTRLLTVTVTVSTIFSAVPVTISTTLSVTGGYGVGGYGTGGYGR